MSDLKNLGIATRAYREHMLQDPYRPAYHFAVPDDQGEPGDPNGAFFADGVYHLMYLYRNNHTNAYHWGHISSVDLLHWRHHPDALTDLEGDEGCFSGGAFVDDDGTAYLSFWKFPSKDRKKDHGGIGLAWAKAPYDKWERMEPIAVESNADHWGIVDIEVDGHIEHVGCADPSNIWKMSGRYYMQAGNYNPLHVHGMEGEKDPHYQSGWTDLFRSDDLKTWTYVHRFYANDYQGEDWPDATEDDMCPSFLPLYDAMENGRETGKWLQLFISHNKGCQYFIGHMDGEEFIPETHGRMSWKNRIYFAPEALVDDQNRHIIWAWLVDNLPGDYEKYGWSGVFSFPRVVWLEEDGLHMAPAKELDNLQYHPQTPAVQDGCVPVKDGQSFRLKATIDMQNQDKAGFTVRAGGGQAGAMIYYDKANGKLVMDLPDNTLSEWVNKEEAPFVLQENESLSLDIFVDKSIIEVYANERQAICRRIYPADSQNAVQVRVIGDEKAIQSLQAWDMAPANPY